MNTTADRHSEAERPLGSVVSAVDPAAWDRPSPCEGWTTRDVLAHIIDTQREFFAGRDIDLGERPSLDDPARAWRQHTARVADVVADEGVVDTAYDGYFGPTTIGATFEQFYIWDMIVHRWDIATGAGLDDTFTDAEIAAVEAGADSFGDSLYMDGVCAPGVEVPDRADRATRLLARLGRSRAHAV
ncbi:TIGR03086 family metal-binding protein [Rhodococcus coprophilus]|uniref:Mycothiol maleylpyruvate isomerase N-terminal domain n=1 Tax=Rhodococcus coprophilus TaxID=38310 RepID=A0A2X4TQK2_9NOCA|nr:TIGR03086 family metal-binding protein [Rhodococcus coprophilus]MBM7457483.1 uncharacterized protein (TIGR03086 family) [Rhodococcus coprophilus]SQI29817.1 Mycothiol maleylpyruvate isomerase N-terminal domain [Rhodococcus coprophilus]